MRLAQGWLPWTAVPLLGSLLAALVWWPAALALAALTVFVVWFFRDPDRQPSEGIVAAADGRIQEIDGRAVTFLNLHHVHVVRAPYEGTIETVERVSGGRLPAFLKGAEKNGGVAIVADTEWGNRRIDLKAGAIARRAVSFVDEGDHVAKGERIGMIRFGSRVDVDLPDPVRREVAPGDRVTAAETTIATPTDTGDASP
ncbi:phosphatidylserine decarboxylase family protein [Thermoplasmatales archaeon SW_10_69_26]|nr:MAG: phosphatidylserine decarboxylase family protein [Thermoplasmatales archaeon SW_10_69_26]